MANQQQLDPRIVQLSVEVNGKTKTYDGLAIKASGTKYANPNMNEAEITIYNLDKTTQDYILTETSPYNLNRTPKNVNLSAGRESYGKSLIYTGNIVASIPSQPPDIGVTLKCLTGYFANGQIITRGMGGTVPLSFLSKQIAADLKNTLIFQTQDKNIANYAYTGSQFKELEHLASVGNINVFADNAAMIVKTIGLPLTNTVRLLDLDSGMIGIPEITEQGMKVKFLLDNKTTLGGGLQVKSTIYPAANGSYVIYKLGFEIANRDTPFYWIAEGIRNL